MLPSPSRLELSFPSTGTSTAREPTTRAFGAYHGTGATQPLASRLLRGWKHRSSEISIVRRRQPWRRLGYRTIAVRGATAVLCFSGGGRAIEHTRQQYEPISSTASRPDGDGGACRVDKDEKCGARLRGACKRRAGEPKEVLRNAEHPVAAHWSSSPRILSTLLCRRPSRSRDAPWALDFPTPCRPLHSGSMSLRHLSEYAPRSHTFSICCRCLATY
ncbi:hypothetical protein B0H15DRAFT_86895 [Mycena belliarum]|uniref:Uncharacterized protein n=1 Tax=Mycena belliarum TaxID=1033014 RepID=A0AAD6TPP2_9AGAR|nr:hypothetical protein B0H15DRAFT_86895 [Mycena belliae]